MVRPGDELVVVDDHSADATAWAASVAGAEVIAGSEPPRRLARASQRLLDGVLDRRLHRCWCSSTPTSRRRPALLDRLAAVHASVPKRSSRCSRGTARASGRAIEPAVQHRGLDGRGGFTVAGRRSRPSPLAFGPVLACSPRSLRGDRWTRPRPIGAGCGGRGPRARHAPSVRSAVHRRPDVSRSGCTPEAWRRWCGAGPSTSRAGPLQARWWLAWRRRDVAVVAGRRVVDLDVVLLASVVQLRGPGPPGRAGSACSTPFAYPVLVVVFSLVFLRSVALTARRRPVAWKGRHVHRIGPATRWEGQTPGATGEPMGAGGAAGAARARPWHEHVLAVVAELVHALADVVEGAMRAGLVLAGRRCTSGTSGGPVPSRSTRRPSGSAASSRCRAGRRRGTGGRCRSSCRTAAPVRSVGTWSLDELEREPARPPRGRWSRP